MRANYLNLLLVLLAGFLPLSMQAAEPEKKVILYTPYTKIAVPPGESVNYNIDVINNGDEVKNADITIKGMPRGWKYEIKAGTWTVNQLSVLPKEKKNFSLKVDIPLKVNKGTYRFSVMAEGLGELPLSITVSKQGTYQTDFTTNQPNMQGNSKSTLRPYGTSPPGMECGLQDKLQTSDFRSSGTECYPKHHDRHQSACQC